MENKKFLFNKSNIDKIPYAPAGEQHQYYDTKTQGFGLRVGSKVKTFILYGRVKNGPPKRITLGKVGVLTVDQARTKAIEELQKLNAGIDPTVARQEDKAKEIFQKTVDEKRSKETVKWLLNNYTEEQLKKKKGGSEGTLRSMSDTELYFSERTVLLLKKNNRGDWVEDKEHIFEDWLNLPYRSITSKDVLERFDLYSTVKPTRGKISSGPVTRTHQIAFRFLRSAYNYQIPRAKLKNPNDTISNPVDILGAYNRWEETKRRKRLLNYRTSELYQWLKIVFDYSFEDYLFRDYFLVSLFQAGRSIEIAPLKWSQVDFNTDIIDYDETKNNSDYRIPMSKKVKEIIQRRREVSKTSEFVFPYGASKNGYVVKDAKYHFGKVAKLSGVLISHHDLRRTWSSIARHLKIDERAINYCLKHKINDVNEHYFDRHEQELREIFQKIEDFIYDYFKVEHDKFLKLKADNVLSLRKVA